MIVAIIYYIIADILIKIIVQNTIVSTNKLVLIDLIGLNTTILVNVTIMLLKYYITNFGVKGRYHQFWCPLGHPGPRRDLLPGPRDSHPAGPPVAAASGKTLARWRQRQGTFYRLSRDG